MQRNATAEDDAKEIYSKLSKHDDEADDKDEHAWTINRVLSSCCSGLVKTIYHFTRFK